jgi:transposase
MADFDFDATIKEMGKAALPFLEAGAGKAKEYGKAEAEKMAQTALMLAKGVATGQIDEEEARLVLEVQKNASRSILLTIKGLGIVAVENAVNGAMDVLRSAIEKATGVAL